MAFLFILARFCPLPRVMQDWLTFILWWIHNLALLGWVSQCYPEFRWVGCLINAQLIEGRLMREELYGDSKLEDLLEFCYLGEMLLLDAAVCWL